MSHSYPIRFHEIWISPPWCMSHPHHWCVDFLYIRAISYSDFSQINLSHINEIISRQKLLISKLNETWHLVLFT